MAKAKKGKLTLEEVLVPVEKQPYEIPENWCWTSLSSVAEWGAGGTPSRKKTDYYGGDIPWIKTGELNDDYIFDSEEKITEDAVINSSAKLFPIGSVLVAMYGATIGKTAILGIPATTNQACACARCNDSLENKYLFYYLRSQKDSFIAKGKGGAQPNISQDIIKSYPIPLPPLAEQKRIVERIEKLFAKLDEAKEKAQEVVATFEIRRAAILHSAFSGQLSSKWRNENGIQLLKDLFELGEITEIRSSKRVYKEDYVEEGIPFFRSTEIVELYDYGTTTPNMYITREKYEEIKSEKGVPEEGNLLVTSVGTIGKTWITDGREFYYKDGNLTEVVKNEKLDMRFLQYFIMSEGFKNQVIDTVSGSAYNALTIIKFKKIKIWVPDILEQQYIVDVLDKLIKGIIQSKEAAEAVIDNVEIMKKSILAKAFRGELGTNNSEEEPAIELLKGVLEA